MADEQNPQLPLTPPPGGDGPGGTGGNIQPINIEEEMRRSYLDYSMSVIIGRALPDVRDGLKPVHRRVLYTMQEMGLQFNKKYTKCAKVVGQAMGQYHPHGDSAIYDTLVRLAQPFSLRYPLIDGQGNFGSVDGDPPAAMRYTECRLKRISGELLTEIPYQVNKSKLIERIAELVNEKTIEDISDVRDESDRDGMRIVIELKRGAESQIVLNQLYKHTQMQESFSMIFLAVANNQPREMGLVQAIQHFIDHRVDVVRRRTAYLLARAREREHILEGYKIALDNLDQVIKLIRGSGSRSEARDALLAADFKITDELIHSTGKLSGRQADAILDLQLYRLTRLSTDEIFKELAEIRERIAEYEGILASEKKLRNVILKELEEVKKEYGDERRTTITDEGVEITLEDLVADE